MLSDMVQEMESARGALAYKQKQSMREKGDPTYGQFSGFQQQYGRGAVGVDNYARQVLAANPDATIGQFYSTYVIGTGRPSRLVGPQELADISTPQMNYIKNLRDTLARHGLGLDTKLRTLMGPVYQD
jgi:hypothetical protein